MVIKTIYIAKDGKEFTNDMGACIQHELILTKLDEIFDKLPKRPVFTAPYQYIQHDQQTYDTTMLNFYKLACEYHTGIDVYPFDNKIFWEMLRRMDSVFYTYGYRFMYIEESTLREYSQIVRYHLVY